ncbi:MAG: DUF1559 domain-containing protein [Pirellulales bacterium]|nr:DUF1559 domain-containing protein [Pirellulales bacterium]
MKTNWPFLFLAALIFSADPGLAETSFDPAARAKAIAPFVDEQTIAVAHVDLRRVNLGTVFGELGQISSTVSPDLAAEFYRQGGQGLAMATGTMASIMAVGGGEFYAVVSTADQPADNGKGLAFVCIPVTKTTNDEALFQMYKSANKHAFEAHRRIGDMLVIGSEKTLTRLASQKPYPRPELEKAFAEVGDTTAQYVLLPPEYARRVIREMMPTLPKKLGGGPSSVLTDGLRWAAVSVDLQSAITVRAVVQSTDARAAGALLRQLKTLTGDLAQNKELRRAVPNIDKVLVILIPKQVDDRLELVLDPENQGVAKVVTLLLPPVSAARTAARRMQSMNLLKQHAIAMHNYIDAKKTFPAAASRDAQGKPLLSWRVHVLPYLEQQALYEKFHLDEPWDSPHNKKLIAQMPQTFRSPMSKFGPEQGRANYVVPVGPGTVFEGLKAWGFRDIRDGTSNTILLLEVDDQHAVVWTKPDDWSFDPKDPKKGLGGFYEEGFLASLCDGSVRTFSLKLDAETLRRLFHRDDRKEIDWDKIK